MSVTTGRPLTPPSPTAWRTTRKPGLAAAGARAVAAAGSASPARTVQLTRIRRMALPGYCAREEGRTISRSSVVMTDDRLRRRADRPPVTVLRPGVEDGGGGARWARQAHAVVREGDGDRVAGEAGRVGPADRMLAEPLAEPVGRLECLVGRPLCANDLHERHERRGIEEMHPDHAFRCRGGASDLGHGERGGIRGENGSGPADAL